MYRRHASRAAAAAASLWWVASAELYTSICRVLANNDVPTGPGRIPLEAALPAHWEG